MIEEFIKEGDLVFDIGANVGNWTRAAQALGAKVVAVEPMASLRASLDATGAIVVSAACGDKSGLQTLHMGDWSTHSSLRQDWIAPHFDYNNWSVVDAEQVTVTTVDNLIETYGKPTFIKIDTEGYEAEVILGMTYAPPALSFEYHGPAYPIILNDNPSLRAAALVNDLGKYEYRCIGGEDHEWITPWMDYRGLDNFLLTSNWGDVYARRTA